ncbi:MAG: hypothetical protein HUK09_01585 [Bacteroidaceae bacterium]|nr:hypothetical protein [Bacteroidaceae bacterium]
MSRILIFLLLMAALPAAAQNGLNVSPVFERYAAGKKQVNAITLKGDKVANYQLSLFRSITYPAQYNEAWNVEKLIQLDAKAAINQESAMKNGQLYYGFFQLPARGGVNRYLFYRNNSLQRNSSATAILIYMEGTASIDQLKRTFGK